MTDGRGAWGPEDTKQAGGSIPPAGGKAGYFPKTWEENKLWGKEARGVNTGELKVGKIRVPVGEGV